MLKTISTASFSIFKRPAILLGVFAILLGMGACTTTPDHARYIPKDALMVTGLNTKALTKKVAWNVITGSKLFKQMQDQMPDKNSFDLDKSGIDVINTFYVYIRGNGSLNGNMVTALVPLSDAGKWELYVKKVFPAAVVKPQGARKLAKLSASIYAGWNDNLLIVMNVLPGQQDLQSGGYIGYADSTNVYPVASINSVSDSVVAIEMENAFSVTKENALTGNPRFAKLLHDDHDMSFWMNYDQLMTQYMSQGMAKMMGGITLSNVLWKDAAFAGGLDFEKGKITGDMRYYVSDDMKEAAKELGGTDADKDMLDKLPKQDLDMAMCLHLSPKGLKAILDKTGLLGLANLALSTQGMNADYIMDAFTGDMAITLSGLDMKKGMHEEGDAPGMNSFNSYVPAFNSIYVLKINKKENFDKLLLLGVNSNMLRLNSNTYAIPISATDSVIIMTSDKYAVVTNKSINGVRYIQGNNKDQKNGAVTKVYGHPFGMYMDIQQMLKWLNPDMAGDAADNKKIAAAKNLLDNMLVTGGAFSNDAFDYHMDLNFMNKDENSLLTLLDFGMKMRQTDSLQAVK